MQFLKKWEVDKMKLRTAKTTYTLSPTQLEEYKHITDGWQRLYQNPDRRLKTTPESEWDVFFRLQEDSWPWNVMTDDVMKFSSLEGSTAPERATIYRLGRTYTRSTSVLLFKEQYKAVPGKQDVSLDASDRSYPLLDGKVQPSFPLTGFWGRRKTRDVSTSILPSFETFMDLTLNFTVLAEIRYTNASRTAHRIYTDQMAQRITRRMEWVASALSQKGGGNEDEASDGEDDVHSG